MPSAFALGLLWSSAVRAETRVYLLRGWFGVFSTGLDNISDDLSKKGIKAETIGHLAWRSTVSEIVKAHAANARRSPRSDRALSRVDISSAATFNSILEPLDQGATLPIISLSRWYQKNCQVARGNFDRGNEIVHVGVGGIPHCSTRPMACTGRFTTAVRFKNCDVCRDADHRYRPKLQQQAS